MISRLLVRRPIARLLLPAGVGGLGSFGLLPSPGAPKGADGDDARLERGEPRLKIGFGLGRGTAVVGSSIAFVGRSMLSASLLSDWSG